ncbi:MAG: hypothetical protein KY475_16505 [Planctomycetes bacterium]|nr:hypothetical protein [Planctomycetota bacterium]
MSEPHVRWCPHCRRLTQNAIAAPPAYDARWSDDPAFESQRVARLKRYCGACGEIWEAVEAPASLMDDLLELPAQLEDARRQLAMLRLLLARDRQNAEESPATLPLRRAA